MNTSTKETKSLKKLRVSNEQHPAEIPNQITLHQNYSNPFNPSTVISFSLNEDSYVSLNIYDSLGRKLQTLVNEYKTADFYSVVFNANGYSSGVYYYQLIIPEMDFNQVKKK